MRVYKIKQDGSLYHKDGYDEKIKEQAKEGKWYKFGPQGEIKLTKEGFDQFFGVNLAKWVDKHRILFWVIVLIIVLIIGTIINMIYGHFGWELPPPGSQ